MSARGIPNLLQIMKRIVAFGNPLLDTTVYVRDNVLLKKYDLKVDGQKEVCEKQMKNLHRDISSYKQSYTAGGCSQNSLRVLQWLLRKQCDAVIFGSVGNDEEAEILKTLLNNDGVKTRYIVQDLPTGKTVALVKGSDRSLVACIGAAEKLPLNDLLAEKDFKPLILQSDFVYIEGYFLTRRTETATYIIDFCNKNNKVIIFNISGEYVCDLCPDTVRYFVENSDIVFGNRTEFEALRIIMNFCSVMELINHLLEKGKNKMEKYGNIFILTDGDKPGTVIHRGEVKDFDVLPVEDMKDTTGAGDAFTGGFIAGLCINKSLEECARIGCYSAHQICMQTGCTIPDYIPDISDILV